MSEHLSRIASVVELATALAGSAAAATSTWQIDPQHAFAQFAVKHLMISTVRGEFRGMKGTISWHEQDITRSTIWATTQGWQSKAGARCRCTVSSTSIIQREFHNRIYGMQKPAPSDSPVHQLIRDRWSPRSFEDKAIPENVLRSLFEAARWAPSSNNEQPWAYIVATKDDHANFAKLLGTLVESNAHWAKNVAALAIAMVKLTFTKNQAPNRTAQYDTGAASAWLTVEATAQGLAVHQMAGFDPEKARQAFAIPAGWEAIAAMAIGYPGSPDALPQPLRDRELAPRTRKPIREFVMSGSWGHTASFAAK